MVIRFQPNHKKCFVSRSVKLSALKSSKTSVIFPKFSFKNSKTFKDAERIIEIIENSENVEDIQNIIVNRKRNLWERKIEHDDFLNVRLGIGDVEPYVKVNYPAEHFTLTENNLRDVFYFVIHYLKNSYAHFINIFLLKCLDSNFF